MSHAQRESVETMLRDLALDAGGDLAVQRPLLEEVMRQAPIGDHVSLGERILGGVKVLDIRFDGADRDLVRGVSCACSCPCGWRAGTRAA